MWAGTTSRTPRSSATWPAAGRAAIVIDDLASTNPWRPRAIELRGGAEAIHEPSPLIRIHPERIVTFGLGVERSARSVIG